MYQRKLQLLRAVLTNPKPQITFSYRTALYVFSGRKVEKTLMKASQCPQVIPKEPAP